MSRKYDLEELYHRDDNYISDYSLIDDFHEKFGLKVDRIHEDPRELEDDIAKFRIGFLLEELGEYAEASGFTILAAEINSLIGDFNNPDFDTGDRSDVRDPEKQLDSLVDLAYVTLGTAHLQGFEYDEAFRRVHAANMAKVRVDSETLEGSVRKSKFDVIKPPGWEPADLSDLVHKIPE